MRYVDWNSVFKQILASAEGEKQGKRLRRAHLKAVRMPAAERHDHMRRNGPNKWGEIKKMALPIVGNKCWYTEVEITGAPLVIDHYRPASEYWWLAYDAENYRLACPWANSPMHNPIHGCAGGKGDNFPLLVPALRAKGRHGLRFERPVILDPCNERDCGLVAFRADGRPVIHPTYAADSAAKDRVERSMLLLNLDHPDFNSKRERLCTKIQNAVNAHEAITDGHPDRETIRQSLVERLAPTAPFSTAARFYLAHFRYLDWVQSILDSN